MISSFNRKEEHTSQVRLLAYYASLDVVVTLKRGYNFVQDDMVKNNVIFCSKMRKESTNPASMRHWKDIANFI